MAVICTVGYSISVSHCSVSFLLVFRTYFNCHPADCRRQMVLAVNRTGKRGKAVCHLCCFVQHGCSYQVLLSLKKKTNGPKFWRHHLQIVCMSPSKSSSSPKPSSSTMMRGCITRKQRVLLLPGRQTWTKNSDRHGSSPSFSFPFPSFSTPSSFLAGRVHFLRQNGDIDQKSDGISEMLDRWDEVRFGIHWRVEKRCKKTGKKSPSGPSRWRRWPILELLWSQLAKQPGEQAPHLPVHPGLFDSPRCLSHRHSGERQNWPYEYERLCLLCKGSAWLKRSLTAEIVYRSSSPDEAALVSAAKHFGFHFYVSHSAHLHIYNEWTFCLVLVEKTRVREDYGDDWQQRIWDLEYFGVQQRQKEDVSDLSWPREYFFFFFSFRWTLSDLTFFKQKN